MATSISLQKRKRADSTLDSITVLIIAKEAIIQATLDERHGKPSNIEDDSNGSDIEQSDKLERGCNIPGLRFKCPKGTKYTTPLKYPPAIEQTYCLARILSNHKDFFEEKSQIEELITERGYKAVFLPKFHCEINLIEMY
jgi:hypothetical protein